MPARVHVIKLILFINFLEKSLLKGSCRGKRQGVHSFFGTRL